ncbi:MAG: FMN-binding protein [Planctomycetota bacterium]|nr:FMN-binding protein [Planctomycetota bacterium]
MIRNLAKFVVILSVACLVIGGGVAALYGLFRGDIERRDLRIKEQAIQDVCPEGASVDPQAPIAGAPMAADAVYAARDSAGRTVAYVAQGEAQGYSSLLKVMVGVRAEDLAVLRVVVLSQQETPGLGATVAEQKSNFTLWEKLFGPSKAGKTEQLINPFLDQFPGKKPEQFSQVQAITAATITSNATKRAVEQAVQQIRDAAGKKGTGAGANE